MKKVLFFLLVTTVIVSCKQSAKGENGVTYKSAVQYNDYIVSRQTTLMKRIVDFSHMSEKNLDSAGKMLDNYVIETKGMIAEIKGMPPFKGDSTLRDAAVGIFSFYKKIFEDDYKKIIEISKAGENMTEEEATKMNNIIEGLTKEEEQYDKAFHNAQKEFASKNNMKLIENEMQKSVDELDKD